MGQSNSRAKANTSASNSIASILSSSTSVMSSSHREFPNEFEDYDGQKLIDSEGKVTPELEEILHDHIKKYVDKWENTLKTNIDWSDYSVYTGTTGFALLHLHIYHVVDKCKSDIHLRKAVYYIDNTIAELHRRKHSFLCGDAGPLAVGAVIYHYLGKEDDKQSCLKRLKSREKDVLQNTNVSDEVLYGRAGYLYALLFIQAHLGPETIEQLLIDNIYKKIIQSGQLLVRREGSCPCPLMYEWHDKKYLGAAHGMTGIFYLLLQVSDPSYIDSLIRPCIEYLSSTRYPSGNFPSSIGSTSGDKLVQWCHGAPGWIYMYLQAYKVLSDDSYMKAACECADVIWKRGLLRKGYGLCHGVAGNAYGFLALYNVTQEEKHLYRAMKFAEWCLDYGEHGCRTPDRALSLFEGFAGTIYFLIDMLHPTKARMPAFEVPLTPEPSVMKKPSAKQPTTPDIETPRQEVEVHEPDIQHVQGEECT